MDKIILKKGYSEAYAKKYLTKLASVSNIYYQPAVPSIALQEHISYSGLTQSLFKKKCRGIRSD